MKTMFLTFRDITVKCLGFSYHGNDIKGKDSLHIKFNDIKDWNSQKHLFDDRDIDYDCFEVESNGTINVIVSSDNFIRYSAFSFSEFNIFLSNHELRRYGNLYVNYIKNDGERIECINIDEDPEIFKISCNNLDGFEKNYDNGKLTINYGDIINIKA